jgi:mono/diheme cytochrome c family protein
MRFRSSAVLLATLGVAAICAPAAAQDNAARPAAAPAPTASPGRDLVAGKCFQCHTDSMFRDGRMDRVSWESAIYRMVGRGGQWTADEIKQMADYLGAEFGPSKPVAAQSR